MYKSDQNYIIKVLVVGDSGVGKTCLIQKYTRDVFQPNHLATIAIDFKLKKMKINEQNVVLQIWDTAGQEKFLTLTKSFFANSDGILVCYSVDDSKSFSNIRRWIQQIKENAPEEVKIILLANKIDLVEERVISTKQGELLAEEYDIPFYECSSKTGEGVDDIFAFVSHSLFQKAKQNKMKQQEEMSQDLSKLKIKRKNCC